MNKLVMIDSFVIEAIPKDYVESASILLVSVAGN